jgi:hypothetical protein
VNEILIVFITDCAEETYISLWQNRNGKLGLVGEEVGVNGTG